MNIFLTGGTGFIGRHTAELLSKTNHKVKLLIRNSSKRHNINFPNIIFVEGDLSDKNSLIKGMKDCEAVINIAGHYTFWDLH